MVFDLQNVVVTGSFGVTTLCPSEDDFRKTLRRADKALYRAEACRNATVLLMPNDEAATLAKADSRRSAA